MTWSPKSRSGARRRCARGRPARACRARSRPRTGRARARARPAARAPPAGRWWRRSTVSSPRFIRRPAISCRTANASSVARLVVGVVGRPAPRQKSERDHLGRLEVLGRERALAGAAWRPSARPGTAREARSSSLEHRHLRRRAGLGVLGADRQEAHARSRARSATRVRPGGELRARPLEAVVGVAECPRAATPRSGCTRRSASSRRRSAAAPSRTRSARRACSRGGSKCSITSTSAAAS